MLRLQNIKLNLSTLIFKMKTKEKHKDLKKKVNIVEKERNLKRGQKSWHDLRTLKKLKLNMKDKLKK
jgi:hypothetical protein